MKSSGVKGLGLRGEGSGVNRYPSAPQHRRPSAPADSAKRRPNSASGAKTKGGLAHGRIFGGGGEGPATKGLGAEDLGLRGEGLESGGGVHAELLKILEERSRARGAEEPKGRVGEGLNSRPASAGRVRKVALQGTGSNRYPQLNPEDPGTLAAQGLFALTGEAATLNPQPSGVSRKLSELRNIYTVGTKEPRSQGGEGPRSQGSEGSKAHRPRSAYSRMETKKAAATERHQKLSRKPQTEAANRRQPRTKTSEDKEQAPKTSVPQHPGPSASKRSTIAELIARFREGPPRPSEARGAEQDDMFWWQRHIRRPDERDHATLEDSEPLSPSAPQPHDAQYPDACSEPVDPVAVGRIRKATKLSRNSTDSHGSKASELARTASRRSSGSSYASDPNSDYDPVSFISLESAAASTDSQPIEQTHSTAFQELSGLMKLRGQALRNSGARSSGSSVPNPPSLQSHSSTSMQETPQSSHELGIDSEDPRTEEVGSQDLGAKLDEAEDVLERWRAERDRYGGAEEPNLREAQQAWGADGFGVRGRGAESLGDAEDIIERVKRRLGSEGPSTSVQSTSMKLSELKAEMMMRAQRYALSEQREETPPPQEESEAISRIRRRLGAHGSEADSLPRRDGYASRMRDLTHKGEEFQKENLHPSASQPSQAEGVSSEGLGRGIQKAEDPHSVDFPSEEELRAEEMRVEEVRAEELEAETERLRTEALAAERLGGWETEGSGVPILSAAPTTRPSRKNLEECRQSLSPTPPRPLSPADDGLRGWGSDESPEFMPRPVAPEPDVEPLDTFVRPRNEEGEQEGKGSPACAQCRLLSSQALENTVSRFLSSPGTPSTLSTLGSRWGYFFHFEVAEDEMPDPQAPQPPSPSSSLAASSMSGQGLGGEGGEELRGSVDEEDDIVMALKQRIQTLSSELAALEDNKAKTP